MTDLNSYLTATQGFLSKADGKDKLLALLQYAAMLASGGEPGISIQVQKSLAGARKPFRIMKPLEALLPLLKTPQKNAHIPLVLLDKLKGLGMVLYFGGDHVVWASSSGLVTDKELVEKAGQISLYGWLVGSVCAALLEAVAAVQSEAKCETDANPSDVIWEQRKKHSLVVTSNVCQASVALALLGIVPMKPRTTAMLGFLTSAISCYQLLPTFPISAKLKET
uniref:Peroxisomal membrane protein 11C n=1 Tax=Polyblepharides amylifera TaxID=1486889 RepID=A0A7R9SV23_9CHLO|mmetsp:Transcript_1220/g.1739  ORF Transcript_1220/g.1739 Transcript_1220/m.1739 type:complete len:223 (+) Transcript_1220:79-747(+)|eukprot:CAMPEP_0196583044 /NCGR_PEP_ID=MMETSP1081-20130531/41818_1 /TAXON_ID=36882 /ORGANISM="Pyramimonas amylifera, Strain CCMP720" /LENGTH=222 /DNA_ID=CAMNT_0041903805 /DNA_START=75 /DNA_END=743 /DNA_ORIENTATION=+